MATPIPHELIDETLNHINKIKKLSKKLARQGVRLNLGTVKRFDEPESNPEELVPYEIGFDFEMSRFEEIQEKLREKNKEGS